jgi:hypothetical protein
VLGGFFPVVLPGLVVVFCSGWLADLVGLVLVGFSLVVWVADLMVFGGVARAIIRMTFSIGFWPWLPLWFFGFLVGSLVIGWLLTGCFWWFLEVQQGLYFRGDIRGSGLAGSAIG